MITRIKKRDLLIASILLILTVLIPIIYAQTGGNVGRRASFKVDLVIANRNPAIKLLNTTGFSVDPVASSTSSIVIGFNVTDADDVNQVNGTSGGRAIVNLTLGTIGFSQFRSQSSCTNTTTGSGATGFVIFSCTVNLQYYDNASASWVINLTVIDSNAGTGRNDSIPAGTPNVFTYNFVSSLSLPNAAINFSNVNINQQNVPANHLILNNTGNEDFDQINITASALVGTTTSSENVPVANFAANITNATAGAGVPLATTPITLRELEQGTGLDNATLVHGHTSAFAPNDNKGNRTLFFWVDVPSSGLSAQLYNATWNLTVVNLP